MSTLLRYNTDMNDGSKKSAKAHRLQSQSVADKLAERIIKGQLQNEERLASEQALAEEFGVARGTLRNALAILNERRMVTTRPGVGSFVSYHGHNMRHSWGWAQATAQTGSPTTTEILSTTKGSAPEQLGRAYGIDVDMYTIVRRRLSGGIPVSVEISHLPSTPVLDLLMERGLLGDSISMTMKAAGLEPVSGVQDARVDLPPEQYRQPLGMTGDRAFLIVDRASFDKDNRLVEFVTSYLNPEHFTLHIEFGGTQSNEQD